MGKLKRIIPLEVLKFFLENPYREVYLRELAKNSGFSPFAIKKYVDLLIQEGLVIDEKRANLRYFKADINNTFFRHLKIAFSINLLLKSGLIDFLKENIANVSSIILFGSMAQGRDDKKSDVDILIIGKEKYINLGEFKEKINKEVTLHIFSWSEWNKKAKQDKAFYFEIISHSIPLYGELPLVKWK